MSNFNWRELPTELAHLKGEVVIGGETINGTGEVEIKLSDPDGYCDKCGQQCEERVHLYLDVKSAKALAETIFRAACDAEWAKAKQ